MSLFLQESFNGNVWLFRHHFKMFYMWFEDVLQTPKEVLILVYLATLRKEKALKLGST